MVLAAVWLLLILAARASAAVPQHIPTWAFVDRCNGGGHASAALVRGWVTYAETDCGPDSALALRDCHAAGRRYCRVMQYLDTNWSFAVEATRLAGAASSNWWLHEPAPNQSSPVFTNTFGGGYLVNQTIPSVRLFFHAYARRNFNADDGLLLDWQSPSLAQELYYSTCGCQRTAEIATNRALRAGHRRMSAALTHRSGRPFTQVDNTLPPNPYLPQGLKMLDHRIGVDGWMIEGEPYDGRTLDPYYSTLLDQIAYIATRTRGFAVPMSRLPASARRKARGRRIQEATMLLGFRPGHLVDWANFEQGSSRLSVWPEEGIYPTEPVQSMAAPRGRGCLAGRGIVCRHGGHNSVKVARGVFRREFRRCYDRGVALGPCAAIVNTTRHSVRVRRRWLRLFYSRAIAFRGGDVEMGGRIVFRPFRVGRTRLSAGDAILLAR